MKISTVITTFNRMYCIERSIRSALRTFPEDEVIVVDDASTDATVTFISSLFTSEIASRKIRLVQLPVNMGVTAAKNVGYEHATGDWIIFLDSDDEYLLTTADEIKWQLKFALTRPIVFFRCRDQLGNFVGEKEGVEVELNLKTYLKHTSFGEALTAINKNLVGDSAPYPADLRGYEGLGCCRLIQAFGSALLVKTVARIYYMDNQDRLSLSHGKFKRMWLLGKGHLILVKEFWVSLGLWQSAKYLIKAVVYLILGRCYQLLRVMI